MRRPGHWIPALLIVIASACMAGDEPDRWSPTSFVEGFPVTGGLDQVELETLTRVAQAFRAVRAEVPRFWWIQVPPAQSLVVVRYPGQPIPTVCEGTGLCGSRWEDLPEIWAHPERDRGEGYRGYCGTEHILVRRYGGAEPHLEALLRHEYAHAVTGRAPHGALLEDLEAEVRGAIETLSH